MYGQIVDCIETTPHRDSQYKEEEERLPKTMYEMAFYIGMPIGMPIDEQSFFL